MDFSRLDEPYICCSSGNDSNSAISLIRIGGFKNLVDFEKNFSINLSRVKPGFCNFSKLLFNDQVVDEVLFTFFKKPFSFNGDNILEIYVHGNILNVDRIIDLFITHFSHINLRQSFAGEFTYRAYLNKKLTFSQVEGLDLLLNANSFEVLNCANSLLKGSLNDSFQLLHNSFINLRSLVEAYIDFSDNFNEQEFHINLNKSYAACKFIIDDLYRSIFQSSELFLSPKVSLLGEPNSGKSSLFNNVLGTKRSIVNEIEGTTRDFVSENIHYKNIKFQLIDTAGIRDTKDSIEQEGISLCLEMIDNSFYKILVINPLEVDSFIFQKYKNFLPNLIVFTHANSIKSKDLIKNFLTLNNVQIPYLLVDNFAYNAEHNIFILDNISKHYSSRFNSEVVILDRHKYVLGEIYNKFNDLDISSFNDIGIFSTDVFFISQLVEELIGTVSPDDLLNNLFSNFCIGK